MTRACRLLVLFAALRGFEGAAAAGPAPLHRFPLDPRVAVRFERAFPNLAFREPVFLTRAPDGTGRVFIVGKLGEISVLEGDDATRSKKAFLDLTSKVQTDSERGVIGLAFDPEYRTNGFFYVHYSRAAGSRGVVSRFRVSSADPDAADPESEVVLLDLPDGNSDHNGGMLAFGPDRMLYASFGDDRNSRNGQDRMTLLGTIVRVDPHGGEPYGIPPDNPFLGCPIAREEIWAYGLRNPWRFSFDRETGDLWTGDVGENREEIDIVVKGGNYGWDRYEGSMPNDNPSRQPLSDFEAPVHEYPRGCVIGGYVYRGKAIPALVGAYVYGDWNSGEIRALRRDGGRVTSNERIGRVDRVTSFAEDDDGELLALGFDGRIWRIRNGGGGGAEPLPQRLSETGLFASTADLAAAPGVLAYDVNAELWADHALKRRWIGLPKGSRIGFSASGNWEFPVGTALVKHFDLAVSPARRQRLETRVLVRGSDGWAGYTYRWNAQGTDADLLPGAATLDLAVEDPAAPGGSRPQVWKFPSREECMQCHTAAAGFVLGVRTHQINRDFGPGNQLEEWNRRGLFDIDIKDPKRYPAMPDPRDESAPLADRARAYLEANCARWHCAGSTTPGGLDLRYGVPLADMNLVEVLPTDGDLGLPGARRVKPGSKEASVLFERMRRFDRTRMPPLGSDLADEHGADLIGTWIDRGP